MKKIVFLIGLIVLTGACTAPIERGGWEEEPYNALCEVLGDKSLRGGYAVFDCDNTTVLHDVTHTLMLYQIENLRFSIAPEHNFLDGLPATDFVLEGLGVTAEEMGKTLSEEYYALKKEFSDSLYLDFRARLLSMYYAVSSNYDYATLCLWEPSLAAGFSAEELNALGTESIEYWLAKGEVWREDWVSPDGRFRARAQKGLVLTDDMKGLYKALKRSKITPYICSASPEWLVEILACEVPDGLRLDPDQVFGLRFLENPDGSWSYDEDYPQTMRQGKVDCIDSLIAPRHEGREPVIVAGDSSGDLAMLKAYPGMRVGLIMNQFRGGEIEALANSHDGRYVGQPVIIEVRQ